MKNMRTKITGKSYSFRFKQNRYKIIGIKITLKEWDLLFHTHV